MSRKKSAAERIAQGNPGRRPITIPKLEAPEVPAAAPSPLFEFSPEAKRIYDTFAPMLRAENRLRSTDEPAFWRYCEALARYCSIMAELRALGGEFYQQLTNKGEVMYRQHPAAKVLMEWLKVIQHLEDRFGLSPLARQQYMLALSRGGLAVPADRQPGVDESETVGDDIPVAGGIH